MVKLIFESVYKTGQTFFYNFFVYKNDKQILSEKQGKAPKNACEKYQNISKTTKQEAEI